MFREQTAEQHVTSVIVQSLPDYTHAQLVTTVGRGFLSDEPASFEGNDLGPTPYEFLTAALGVCTAMTLQLYARRKQYPLHEVAIEVEFDRVHADDCEGCIRDEDSRIDVLTRKIVVKGPLDDAQKADLLRVAARCPVHRTLENAPRIVDTIEVVG
jgi:putative redox protein